MLVNVFLLKEWAHRQFGEKNTLYEKHEEKTSFIIYNVQLPPKKGGRKGYFFSLLGMVAVSVKMQMREVVVGQIALHQRRNLQL